METKWLYRVLTLAAVALVLGSAPALASNVNVQCPGDLDGDGAWNSPGEVQPPGVECMHLSGGDGFVTMADGTELYIFSFADLTGIDPAVAPVEGILAAEFPAPTIVIDEGYEFYLTLTNVGMLMRPDLFDPHTVHFHGFPQASSVFDGLPESAIAINMGSSLTYYYLLNDPGTYMYHCHVEATEHMQMGMLGNLYVRPRQNYEGCTATECPTRIGAALTGLAAAADAPLGYAYNDGDGSTAYDREYPIQVGSFDSNFHIKHIDVQPLPFAEMRDDYPMLNGRGYPDTINPNPLPVPASITEVISPSFTSTQPVSTLIQAAPGEQVLLRISNLNVTRYYTLGTMGIPMHVIARDAKLLRGPTGIDLSYVTNSITIGGGESVDVMLDTTGAADGDTFFLYTTNLNCLNNSEETEEGMGGMLTEIRIIDGLAPQAVPEGTSSAPAPTHNSIVAMRGTDATVAAE